MNFLHIEAAWAFLACFVWWALESAWRIRQAQLRVNELGQRIAGELQQHAPLGRASAWFFAALLSLVVAAMQPSWSSRSLVEEQRGCDVVICLDLSRSMLAADLYPSRLARAQADIRNMVGARPQDRFALVGFAGTARTLIPMTDDHASFLAMLDLASPAVMPVGGTDLGAALLQAARSFSRDSERAPVLMLLSDGEDHDGRALQTWQAEPRAWSIDAVAYGTELGAKIVVSDAQGERYLTDAQGNEVVSRLEPDSLLRLAEQTQGSYRAAASDQAWDDWLKFELPSRATWFQKENGEREPVSQAAWFLGLSLLLLLAAAWRGGPA